MVVSLAKLRCVRFRTDGTPREVYKCPRSFEEGTSTHILTDVGYVGVYRRPSGWWEVQRGKYRAVSLSLPRALWFLGFETAEARAIAGCVFRDLGPSPAGTSAVG